MRCSDFLALYSDYRDDLVRGTALRSRLERHVRDCPRCRRYDAHVSRGVMVLRSSGTLEPTRRFRRQLARRVAADRLTLAPHRFPMGLAAALLVSAVVSTLLWQRPARTELVEVAPVVTTPVGAVRPSPADDDLVVPAFGEWRTPGSSGEPFITPVVFAP